MAEEQTQNGQQQQTAQQQHEQEISKASQDTQTQEKGHEKYVPYERFQEVVSKHNDLEKRATEASDKASALEQRFEAMRKAFSGDKDGAVDTTEEFNDMLKVGPKAYFEKLQGDALSQFVARTDIKTTVEKFRSLPDYSTELEASIGKFIQENDLQSIGASKALSVAYRAVTGKNMGENSEKSYDTKKVKENLGRPGSGSGKGKETIDLKNMSLEDFRKNEKEIYAQVMAQAGRE